MSVALFVLTGALLMVALPMARFSTVDTSIGVVGWFGGASDSLDASLSVSPTTPTTQGDVLVAMVKNRDLGGYETVAGVTDSSGNTWAPANRLSQGKQADEEVWYSAGAASIGTQGSVTATLTGGAAIAMTVLDVAGASATPLEDVASSGDASASASTGSAQAAPQDIVIADIGWNANVTPANQTGSFNTVPIEQSTVSNSMTGEQAAWEVAGGSGTQSYGADLSQAVVWTATIATFDAAGSGSPTPTPTPTPTSTPTATPTPTASATPSPSPSPSPTPTPTPTPTISPPNATHVMVIMEENKGYQATLGACGSDPYLCSLASGYASYTNWNAITHPSLPNYLAFVSGSTQGCSADTCSGGYSATSLGGQLSSAGIPWTAYMESMPSACDTNGQSGLYAKKHNPFVFFNDVLNNGCASNVVPYPGATGLVSDLNGAGAPQFVWITPNLSDDMHNGSVAQGDAWLLGNVAPVLSSPWFTNFNSTVIITMDENNGQPSPGGGGQVPMVVISSHAQGQGGISSAGNLYGTLRGIEEAFGLGYLGAAADPSNGDPIGSF